MTTLNNGATASALPAYLKSEIEQMEAHDLKLQELVNSAKDAGAAAEYIELQNINKKSLVAKKAEYKAAVVDSLPAPIPLTPDIEKATPYPVDELPPIIRDAANAIAEKVKAPVALAGQCVIGATVYLALPRANVMDPIGEPMPINTAMLSLADSGDRKSACHRLAFQPVAEQEQMQAEQRMQEIRVYNEGRRGLKGKELEEYEGAHAVPEDVRTLYSDATFERIAGDFINGKTLIFWDTDEGGQMLSGHSLKSETRVATIGGMTKLLDRGFVERMRSRGNAETSGTAYQRRFAIHLMAQSIAVSEALNDPLLRGQGLLARFLLTAPESLAGTRTLTLEELVKQSEPADADPRVKRYWTRISELLKSNDYIDPETGNATPPTLELTAGAQQLWLELYNETEHGQGRFEKLGDVKQFAARTGDQARKLAAAFAVFEGIDHVDAKCMKSAVAVVRHSIAEWARHAEDVFIDQNTKNAIAVIDWLTHPDRKGKWAEFTRDQFGNRGYYPFRHAKKRDQVLATLVEHNHLHTSDGRNYMINPHISNSGGGAESAESAESQQVQGLLSADRLRTSADKSAKSGAARTLSAPIRKASATTKPCGTGLSAKSAKSAGVTQGRAVL